MLKKTSAAIGLGITTATGVLLSGAPAQAQSNSISDCCISHHIRHHSSNWNGNRTRPRIFIRIYIYNKNNNAAVARNGARQRQLQREPRRDFPRRDAVEPLGTLPQPVLRNDQLTAAPFGVSSFPVRTTAAQVPVRGVVPQDNGQVSTNGIARPIPGNDTRPGNDIRPQAVQGSEQNGNLGDNNPNQDISPWLTPALS